MRELALHTLNADADYLVLVDTDGQQYRLAIDDALRSAVRSDRPYLEAIRAGARSALPPRDIQARLRAGETLADVAAAAGLPEAAIERYESPVLAERAWMVEQTQKLAIGHEVGAPTLGDLVIDRLAARGEPAEVAWDARRAPGGPWEVSVRFGAEGEHQAVWQVDLQARSLTALNAASRLLSETDLQERRIRSPFDVEAEEQRRGADLLIRDSRSATTEQAAQSEPDAALAASDGLLERLGRARGRRAATAPTSSPLGSGTDAPAPGNESGAVGADESTGDTDPLFPVAPVVSFAPVVAQRGHRDAGGEESSEGAARAESEPAAEPADEAVTPPPKAPKRGRSRRASVPAWDEIIFGAPRSGA